MDKRYQVFVSSTYADLQNERQKVMQALMKMDCIPAGMELFPAADEKQLEFIKKVIDDCDYYVVIIGGRYGTLTPEGVSYTQQEYSYAKSLGIPVLAFLHSEPDQIVSAKTETDPDARDKLLAFREELASGRLVDFWKSADELPGVVALSLLQTMKTHPAVGWVRATTEPSTKTLLELNEVRKENESLRRDLEGVRTQQRPKIDGLAGLDEETDVKVEWWNHGSHDEFGHKGVVSHRISWRELFALASPFLQSKPVDNTIQGQVGASLWRRMNRGDVDVTGVQMDDLLTIRVQFEALGLVELQKSSDRNEIGMSWCLTDSGYALMLQCRAVRGSSASPS